MSNERNKIIDSMLMEIEAIVLSARAGRVDILEASNAIGDLSKRIGVLVRAVPFSELQKEYEKTIT